MKEFNVPVNFKPLAHQIRLFKALDRGIKNVLLVWPRQSGKDHACVMQIFRAAVTRPGNYFYILPTKEDARRVIWEKIVQPEGIPILDFMPEDLILRRSNQEMQLEVKSGPDISKKSTIRFLGVDKDADTIRGISPTGIVFSEFGFMDPDTYKNVLPAIERNGAWQIINSTPAGRNHFYRAYKFAQSDPEWYCDFKQCLWPDRDNFIYMYPQQYFDKKVEQGIMNIEDVEREYGCSFATGMRGAFYIDNIERAYEEGRIGEFVHDETLLVDTFWDLGVDDSTAVWFRQKINNKIIFIDYYEDDNKNLLYYVRMLESKGYRYGTHYLPHDARQRSIQTGLETADMFEDILRSSYAGGRVHVLDKLSVQSGITAVKSKFNRYHFDAGRCKLGLDKLELYHRRWDPRRQVFLKEPVHDGTSHAADALRMEGISEDVRGDAFYRINKIKAITDYDIF